MGCRPWLPGRQTAAHYAAFTGRRQASSWAWAGVNTGVLLFVGIDGGRPVWAKPMLEEDAPGVRRHVAAVISAVLKAFVTVRP